MAIGSQVSQEPTSSTRDRVYSVAQASRGEALYDELCLACHPRDAYIGEGLAAWKGRRLADLYELLEDTMPKHEPGSLTAAEYAAVIAYLLRLNGMPAGAADLPSDQAVLRRILIDIDVPLR